MGDPRLNHSPHPPELGYLWELFRELGGGISWVEIEAWQKTMGRKLARYEIRLIIRLNNKRLEIK